MTITIHTQVSCGCCVGPEEDRCCCHFHQDITRGLHAHKCSLHREPLRLIRATAASWTKEREAEARERGYRVEYEWKDGMLLAWFFNGPIFCYSREWTP